MGNGEWGMGNGEWGMGNGEWGMGNGEWQEHRTAGMRDMRAMEPAGVGPDRPKPSLTRWRRRRPKSSRDVHRQPVGGALRAAARPCSRVWTSTRGAFHGPVTR
ncbi:hypothetical protein FKV25_10310 [Lysobacter aestuarii]|uniref:Uncharacterized protein n=1 Tax=Marilutibacter aestuarii TaxID=1706195 RepID=A0A508A0D4_9GAMM|nr:hypothetical protein FKV25_10310 [Lysobacter aestuarii]